MSQPFPNINNFHDMSSSYNTARVQLLYLRWPAQPLWGNLSPLPSHWRWRRGAPGAPGTAGYSGTQKPWGEERELLKAFGFNQPLLYKKYIFHNRPANQTEPGEAVVEGVAPRQGMVAILHSAAGQLCSTVIHLSHQVQSLPAGGSIKRKKIAWESVLTDLLNEQGCREKKHL